MIGEDDVGRDVSVIIFSIWHCLVFNKSHPTRHHPSQGSFPFHYLNLPSSGIVGFVLRLLLLRMINV